MRPGAPLPLASDGSGRFLPWLIAIMAFLAALAIAGAGLIGANLDRWNEGLEGSLTALLPPPGDQPLPDETVQAALGTIRSTPGVQMATALDRAATERLLRPWLGDDAASLGLILPVVVDIKLMPGREIDRDGLEQRLRSLVPQSAVERRGAWLDGLYRLARSIEAALWLTALLVGLASIMAVVFVTRTGLALHAELIDLLHVMGASDAYVAGQFQARAFHLGFRGGLIGLVASFFAFGALRLAGEGGSGAPGLVGGSVFGLALPAAITIFLLPVLLGAVAWLTARGTVLHKLARLN